MITKLLNKLLLLFALSALSMGCEDAEQDFEDEATMDESAFPRDLFFDNIPTENAQERTAAVEKDDVDGVRTLYSSAAYSCGPHLLTYAVESNSGLSGVGVRCVKMISSNGEPATFGPTFVFYGEGRWGSLSYRNVGEVYRTSGDALSARAADITGNGETASGKLSGGEVTVTTSGGSAPSVIRFSGAWNETWRRVSRVYGYSGLSHVKTCGPHFDKYRAESLTDPEAGFGVRCRLKGTDTWYGEGLWGGRRYLHLGSAAKHFSFAANGVVSSFGASDICRNSTDICGNSKFGSLTFTPRNFNHVGDGYEIGGWNERWLPYSRRYAIRIDAVRVANANGSRRARITPAQISEWVDYANRVYRSADVEFLFIEDASGPDFRDLADTLVNSMTGGGPSWNLQRTAANAASREGRQTVFFRWGNGSAPTGGGFSGGDLSFVAMPGFNDTWLCGQNRNLGLFAHESGHFFGLNHTFVVEWNAAEQVWKPFEDVTSAENYFVAHGRNPSAFDGDGLSGTANDPFIEELQCTDDLSVQLAGTNFSLPRGNIMGYWSLPSWAWFSHSLSNDQIAIVHNFIKSRRLD